MAKGRFTRMRGLAPLLLAAVLCTALTACDPAGDPAGNPTPESSPSASSVPEPSETPLALTIPGSCDELIALDIVTGMFAGYELLPASLLASNPDAQAFSARGGLTCAWGLPASEAMLLVFVADRANSSDAEWVEEMETLGFAEGPAFLDECMVKVEDTEVGTFVTARSTVEGYELYVFGNGSDYNPYLTITRAATDSMGYL